MEILGFLFGLGCLVLVAWAIAILGGLVFGRKRRQQNRHQQPPSLTHPEIQERNSPSIGDCYRIRVKTCNIAL